jgi:DNA mismatch repair protein MutS
MHEQSRQTTPTDWDRGVEDGASVDAQKSGFDVRANPSSEAKDVLESSRARPTSARVAFESILSAAARPTTGTNLREDPQVFGDLNIDQLIDRITMNWKEYDLAPLFSTSLADRDSILYRQEVMREMDGGRVADAVATFSERMRGVRTFLNLSNSLEYKYEKERWCSDSCRCARATRARVAGIARVPQLSRILCFLGSI